MSSLQSPLSNKTQTMYTNCVKLFSLYYNYTTTLLLRRFQGGGFNATLQQEGATSGNFTNNDKGSDNSADATITKLVEKETSKTSRNVLYKQIKQYVEAGFVVGCERFSRLGQMDLTMKSPSAKATFTDEDGVLIRHAYVVVDMGEINGTQLVRIVNPWMVNPWPTGQYFKEWSRNSKQHEQGTRFKIEKKKMKNVIQLVHCVSL